MSDTPQRHPTDWLELKKSSLAIVGNQITGIDQLQAQFILALEAGGIDVPEGATRAQVEITGARLRFVPVERQQRF